MPPLRVALLLLALVLAACDADPTTDPATPAAPAPSDAVDPLEELIADMAEPHESKPHGVPYDWGQAPRLAMGNDPGDFEAFITWGQLYEAIEGNPATNSRVQIRNLRAYLLSKSTGAWTLLQADASVDGAAYVEDFVDDVSKPADLRAEDEGVSVTAGDGYNFHFWSPSGRVTIDPDDVGGIVTSVEARLILDDPAGPDDRDAARYVLDMGADYWLSLDAEWDQWTTNGDVGIGRFKYVRPAWRTYYMHSLTAEALRANPPPIGSAPHAPVGQTVWLRAEANGQYVEARQPDLPLRADAASVGPAGRYAVVDAGGGFVALRSEQTGKYVAATSAERALFAEGNQIGADDRFAWEENEDGTVCLRSERTGLYVAAEDAGASPLVADRAWCRAWERFEAGVVAGAGPSGLPSAGR